MPKDYQQDFGSIITSKTSFIDEIINLARKSSIFYLLFGLACCGIELMQTGGPRADIDRFGSVPRATPRQSDSKPTPLRAFSPSSITREPCDRCCPSSRSRADRRPPNLPE